MIPQVGAFANARERPLGFAFAESETAQRPERLRVRRGRCLSWSNGALLWGRT